MSVASRTEFGVDLNLWKECERRNRNVTVTDNVPVEVLEALSLFKL